jgi:hypothetical protein
VLVIVVDEKPRPMAIPGAPGAAVLRPLTSMRDRLMFMPIVTYTDGYGLSYGGRATFANTLGPRSRVSVPLTWGAVKRAAVEAERSWRRGPLSRIEAGAALGSRENPFFLAGDRRQEVWLRAERALVPGLRLGGRVGWADVTFGSPSLEDSPRGFDVDERLGTYGLDLTLDTRRDPSFPRDAVYARVAWDALRAGGRPAVNRYTADARGFVGLAGTSVLSVRALYGTADAPLPPYEQWLAGGSSTLRGFHTGSFAGDQLLATSAELRIPLTSPLKLGKFGVSLFYDAATTAAHGARLREAPFHRGGGAGLFFVATVFRLNLDIARGSGGATRLHVGAGFAF